LFGGPNDQLQSMPVTRVTGGRSYRYRGPIDLVETERIELY
jgi:hypothetical protein